MLVLALTSSALLAAPQPAIAHHIAIEVTSPQLPAGHPNRPFQATKILDLQLEAVFPKRISGSHLLELEVYTPRGKLYQVLSVPFSGDGAGPRAAKPRRVSGYPRALPERDMRGEERSGYRVSARLPVAGTWVVTNSLYGRWRVEAHVDGDEHAAGTETFTIEP